MRHVGLGMLVGNFVGYLINSNESVMIGVASIALGLILADRD